MRCSGVITELNIGWEFTAPSEKNRINIVPLKYSLTIYSRFRRSLRHIYLFLL